MCGITGIYSQVTNFTFNVEELSNATQSLNHRGPDFQNTWSNGSSIGLGHARLSILDLSAAGNQPMQTEDGRITLVFNGEIYNFKEIKKELVLLGHKFYSASDAEVVLRSFQEWRSDCVKKFIGMFAIAIWDNFKKCLYLFRDRVGVKPLYYGYNNNTLWFGSELKALREYSHWVPEIDYQALGEYFQYGYISEPRSIYKQIRKLEPGHWLEISENNDPSIRSYWDIVELTAGLDIYQDKETEEELVEQLEDLLIDASKYRMISDVPVGVFLSGGIDSSLVAALLQKHGNSNVHTFTIGFQEDKFDESVWARKVSEHLGTKHREEILSVDEAKNILPSWGNLYDEPFGDSSGIPTLLLSQMAKQDVKVALSADGGDELFAGYDNYTSLPKRLDSLNRIPVMFRLLASMVLSHLSRQSISKLSNLLLINPKKGESVYKLVDRACKLAMAFPKLEQEKFFDLAISYWLAPEINKLIGSYNCPRKLAGTYADSFVASMQMWDFLNYLPGDILTKVDRATMSVGLEGREPLLDHRLVEFAFKLPFKYRIGKLGSKHLLRKILYKYVPKELIDRPKQGFGIPLENWLREDMSQLVDDYLDCTRIKNAGVFDPRIVKQTVTEFKKGYGVDVNRVWLLLAFEMWRDRWAH